MRYHLFRVLFGVISLSLLVNSAILNAQENPIQPGERDIAKVMLDQVHSQLKNSYYDPKFHGVDIEARFKEAAVIINKATSFSQALGAVAWALIPLNDSHTNFVPPRRPFRINYGFRMQMIGERCLVTAVKPGSDAEKKGLKAGDEISSIAGTVPDRESFYRLMYLINVLRPQSGLVLKLRNPDGTSRDLAFAASVREKKRIVSQPYANFMDEVREIQSDMTLYRNRSVELAPGVMLWKMPWFMMNEKGADEMVGKARKGKVLILDMRGNPGGSVDTLDRMLGNFFDHDVKVADLKMRNQSKPEMARSRHDKAFAGQLIVLVDSKSSSAAEVFARVVQLEKRGTILGDQSSGLVMESEFFPLQIGGWDYWGDAAHSAGTGPIFYGAMITRADLIMADGKSLEHSGLTPDEIILPAPEDLAKSRDPVLARAAKLAGVDLTPEKAAELFPIEWPAD